MRRTRGFVIALVAAVLELAIVAGVGNQWVTQRVVDNTTNSQVGDTVVRSATAFGWRFTARSGHSTLWAAQLIGAGVLVVLVFLFVLALTARARPSFIRIFVGVWGVTLLAAVIAGAVRQWLAFPDLYPTRHDQQGLARWANALVEGPSSPVVIFGVGSGFIVALVAAAVASATAQEVPAAAMPTTEGEPPWSPDTAPPWGTEYAPTGPQAEVAHDYTAPLPEQPYASTRSNPELARYASQPGAQGEPSSAEPSSAEPHSATERFGGAGDTQRLDQPSADSTSNGERTR
jgi:hypothetical protein